MEHYYSRVDTTIVFPKPNKGIDIMPARKKKKKKKKKKNRKTKMKSRLVFSVQRLRLRVANFFRVLKRWRRSLCPYCHILSQKSSKPRSEEFGWRSRSSSSSSSSSSASAPVYAGSGNYRFYSEAIADCLEFIKRNSISVNEKKDLISLSDVC